MLTSEVPEHADIQHTVSFDPKNKLSIVSTGTDSVIFWNWEEFNFEYYVCRVLKSDFSHLSGKYTCSLFLSGTNTAITATSDGFVIVWEPFNERIGGAESRLEPSVKKKHMKAASKVKKGKICHDISFHFILMRLFVLSPHACPGPSKYSFDFIGSETRGMWNNDHDDYWQQLFGVGMY